MNLQHTMRSPQDFSTLPEQVRLASTLFAELFSTWPLGKYALSIGGSIGKGMIDERSDIDFRLWHELDLPRVADNPDFWRPVDELVAGCAEQGVKVDGVLARKIETIDSQLTAWVEGRGKPVEILWTVWGYHMPVDVFNQCVVYDPHGILARWRSRLTPYPRALRDATLKRSLPILKYWRTDYHYQSKVARGDAVFLASLSARIVHHQMLVLFAINGEYFPGDGANLAFAENFKIKPVNLAARVLQVLYPGNANGEAFSRQYDALASLTDEVLALAEGG